MQSCRNRLLIPLNEGPSSMGDGNNSTVISQVIIPMDDDVTVLNRPVETKYYSPPPDHVHTEVGSNLFLVHIFLQFVVHQISHIY